MLPDNLREFGDTAKARGWIYDNALESVKKRFPIEDDEYKLDLVEPHYDGRQDYTLADQKNALLKQRRLYTPIKGTWRLTHKPTGAVVDEREDTVMQVPFLTARGTFIHNGNEYSGVNQSRLKPGVYSRVTSNGNVEAFYNVAAGTGKNFRIEMEPSTGVFRMRIAQANIPVYPLMRSLGYDDQALMKAWGPEIMEANTKVRTSDAVDKLHARLIGAFDKGINPNKAQAVADAISKYEVDPDVVTRTLGIRSNTLTPEMFLRSTQKLLSISKGEEDPDDRDAPMFSNVLSYEDFIKERIDRDAGKLTKSMFMRAKRDKALKRIPFGALNPYIDGYIMGSKLTMPLEETNPMHTWDQMHRVVKMGEGGISSAESVTDAARDVNLGQLGFIDPVAGPECLLAEALIYTKRGWISISNITLLDEIGCLIDDKLVFNKPSKLHAYDYDGELIHGKTKFINFTVTPNHRMWVRPYDDQPLKYRFETADITCTRRRYFKCGGQQPYTGSNTTIISPIPGRQFNIDDWCEFMGWFQSEGCTSTEHGRPTNAVIISQVVKVNSGNCGRIHDLLKRMGLKYSYNGGQAFRIGDRDLADYCRRFGNCYTKYIPEELFHAPISARLRLLESLLRGDGRLNKSHTTYCTTSIQLGKDVERLAIGLGWAVNVRIEKENRQSHYYDNICVCLYKLDERVIFRNQYTKIAYKGKVYCLTVPGGLFLVKHGNSVPFWVGNSYGIGVDTRVTYKTYKGKDRQMYGEFMDTKTNKLVHLRPEDIDGKTLAFPGEDMSKPDNMVTASRRGKIVQVPASEVDLQVPSMAHMFAHGVNAGTMPTGMMPGRSFYASKYWSQLMPLSKGEVPLVDTLMPDSDGTFLEHYGKKVGTITAATDGVVTKVTPDSVVFKGADGKRYTHDLVKDFPFNRLTGISYFPAVKPGDQVKAGGILAHSNFTDPKTGSLTMGTNLKVAIVPAKGHSYEDAYVISESAAKKLTNERLLGFDLDAKHGVEINKNKYISLFPAQYSQQQIDKMDDRGIIKPGTTVNAGDPLILGIGPKILSAEELKLGKLHKALRSAHTNRSVIWEHDYPGVVTDVEMPGRTAVVNVKASAPIVVGDKIVTMHALKGVVGKIVPDDKMPTNAATNEPYEVLLNPMGILSRVSPNQLAVIQLAKIAKKTGQQLRIPQEAPKEGWAKWTLDQLQKHGIKESSDIFDPETGKTVPGISDGYVYVSAFHHLAEKKLSDRGGGGAGGYTSSEQPAHGGHTGGGAKRFGGLDINAALSHGAHDVIKDVINVRGAKNEEFWKALKLGRPLPETKVPFVYDKFLNLLKAGGINLRQKGDTLGLLPMTDDDIGQLSKGAITSSEMVDRNFDAVEGGLFDLGKTGGLAGNQWSHIDLPDPVPNPVFEEPIRRMLGLKQSELEDVISGVKSIDGKTGGAALKDMLGKLDIDAEIERHKQLVTRLRGSNRDNSIKVIGYLESLKKQGIHPSKLMISKVPVLPPVFRPVSKMGDIMLQADLNELYRDVLESSNHVRKVSTELGDAGAAEERLNLYNSVKASFGLGSPITPEGRAKGLKGAIHQIIGNTPKCYDDATELLTRTGWVPFPDVDGKTDVATVNPVTGMFEWQRPDAVVHTVYTGKMVHTYTKKLDLCVTPNHEHWIQCRIGNRKVGDEQWAPFEKVLASTLVGVTRRLRYVNAADGFVGTMPVGPVDCITDLVAFAEFVGLWVAEGWLSSGDGSVVYLAQKTGADADYIEALLRRTGLPFKRADYFKKHASQFHDLGYAFTYWSLTSPVLATWLKLNCGEGADSKHLSTEILGWGTPYLRAVLSGYLFGAGERHVVSDDPATNATYYNRDILLNRASRASTTSIALVDDLAEACVKVGLGFKLTDVIRHDNLVWNTQYRFRLFGWNKVIVEYPEQTQYIDYTGSVHCVQVPNGLLIVRRNGKTAVSGNSGLFQSKVIAKPVDVVGRGVITPDPSLDMDSIGIPEDSAWTLYTPFIMRNLVRRGYPAEKVLELIKAKDDSAKTALQEEMKTRPVIVDRAPTWHKFNLLAFHPHLVKDKVIRVSPLVTSGFNADFNGDSTLNPLVSCCIDGEFLVDYMANLLKRFVPDYEEDQAVLQFGKQTTIFGLKAGAMQVLGIKEDGTTGYVDVDNISIHTSHGPDCYHIRTHNGLDGVFTAHHNFWALNDDCDLVPVKTETIGVGSVMPYAANFDIPECDFDPKAPNTLIPDFETGFWFGHYLGDGSVTGRVDTISHASTDETMLDYLEKIGKNVIHNVDPWREGNGCSTRWTKRIWAEYVASFGKNADGKCIQSWMLTAPIEFKLGLIAGLFAAEGNAETCDYRIELTSRCILVQFKFLLESMGCICRLTDGKPERISKQTGAVCKQTWLLRVNTATIAKLNIPWPDVRKCDQFKNARIPLRENWNLVPLPKCVIALCDVQGKKFEGGGRRNTGTLRDKDAKVPETKQFINAKRTGYCTRSFARLIIKGYGLNHLPDNTVANKWIALVENDTIRWDRITEYRRCDRPDVTYDLQVPGMEAFTIDGTYLTHNTMNFHVPVSDKAIKNAYDKMMPSRNLTSLTDLKSVRHPPSKEFSMGLYMLTRNPSNKPVTVFPSVEAAKRAYKNGEIRANDPIEIKKG